MRWKVVAVVALAALLGIVEFARAAASDYVFEPVNAAVKKGDDVAIAVRLINKATGKPVPDAVIFRVRIDMAPDGMAEMESPISASLPEEPGVYPFKADLSMPGRYQLGVAAKVQGEVETVIGKVVITVTK